MKSVLVSATIVLVLTGIDCTNESPYQPVVPTYSLSGTVYSEYCVWYLPAWFRYSDSLGLAAEITVIDTTDGKTYITATDSMSDFSLTLPVGTYYVEVETPHCYPETLLTVTLSEDVSVDLYSRIEWHWHDTISFWFFYPTGDSLYESEELILIEKLDSASGYHMDLEKARFEKSWFPPGVPEVGHNYYVPFDFTEVKAWRLESDVNQTIWSDSLTYPTTLYASLYSVGCLD